MGLPLLRPSVPPAPPLGAVVAGKYQLEEILGQGGMGVVYAARHLVLGQSVAIKFLRADSGFTSARARFLREAQSAARLSSEHVARVLDADVDESGAPYIVLERLVGTDLCAALRGRGPLPLGEVAEWIGQACHALAEAHAQGIVHRDLKPSNLFLARRADGTTILKVLDFGIAKVASDDDVSLTQASGLVGSPAYMSPEHLRDASLVDARSDIWALGVILHEALSGRHPFVGSGPVALGARIALGHAVPLREHWPDAPEEICAIVARALAVDPAARFASVAELAAALSPLARSEGETRARATQQLLSTHERTVALAPEAAPSSAPISSVQRATDRFRRQHEELAKLAAELLRALRVPPAELGGQAAQVRRLVARFAGKLSVHATMENDALYPRLLVHGDPKVRDKARELYDEVGTLYGTFGDYTRRWPHTASVEADPAGFAEDTRRVLEQLGRRMFREHEELYPLVDGV